MRAVRVPWWRVGLLFAVALGTGLALSLAGVGL